MAYCFAAHRVRRGRVGTLIGLTALGGLKAQRAGVGVGRWGEVDKPKPDSCPAKGSICSPPRDSVCHGFKVFPKDPETPQVCQDRDRARSGN